MLKSLWFFIHNFLTCVADIVEMGHNRINPAHAKVWAVKPPQGGFRCFTLLFLHYFLLSHRGAILKVWVYIDGFNLYNGIIRGTSHKWLDLFKFSQTLLPSDQIDTVKFFSAKVDRRAGDPDQPLRQIAYWKALRTVPQIQIIEGHFLSKDTWMPAASSVQQIKDDEIAGINVLRRTPAMVCVHKSEEKGTDVNLATHLVNDAHLKRFDAALIISNDSDLNEAIRIVKDEIGLTVGIYSPHKRPSVQLKKTASFFREIKITHLAASQFPNDVIGADGNIIVSRPGNW